MLSKLLKQEFRATSRIMLPVYGLLLLSSVSAGLLALLSGHYPDSDAMDTIATLAITVYGFVAVGAVLLTMALMVYRFYKNLMTDEGYLMFTLPVSRSQLIWAKLIASVVWSALTAVLGILSMLLATQVLLGAEGWQDLGDFCRTVLGVMGGDANALLYGLELLLVALLLCLSFYLRFYAAIATGHSFSNRKMLLTVLIYLGFGLAGQILSTVVLGNLWFRMLANTGSSLDAIQDFHSFWWVLILYYALWSAGLYVLTLLMTKKRLNLQ